jgi:hypothetical protein
LVRPKYTLVVIGRPSSNGTQREEKSMEESMGEGRDIAA